MGSPSVESNVFSIERPHANLLAYYFFRSFGLGPFFLLALLPLFFRYHTLRYRFDDEGVSVRWGILFHREIHLTYSRIQDIHLRSNFVERWLRLARIEIQTASGSARAEMTVEGILEYEDVRDFLYSRMRGLRRRGPLPGIAAVAPGGPKPAVVADEPVFRELTRAMLEVAGELRAIRLALSRQEGEVRRPDA